MRRVLTHSVYALVLLGGIMGASPGHMELGPPSTPAALPLPRESASAAKLPGKKPYQVGYASWYGDYFQGRPTASGENYDMYDFTAAHLELPLGTYVKVTNLRNHRSVIVRVNDRGPVVPGRILDLSYAAARSIGMSGYGVQKVRIDVVRQPRAEMAMAARPNLQQ